MTPWQLAKMRRWCFTGTEYDGSMVKAPFAYDPEKNTFAPISVTTDHSKLITFDELQPILKQHPERGYGYVLTEGDGFTCMDIDIGDHTPVSATAKWWELIQRYETFTEASRSGSGYHLWFKGEVHGSYKRNGMEIYSKERFIICTGNVILEYDLNDNPQHIRDFNEFIQDSRKLDNIGDIDQAQSRTDQSILDEAYHFDNSGKFKALMEGDWEEYSHVMEQQGVKNYVFDPSQADCAFMTIVTFFTRNIEQCKRLWRMSALANIKLRYPGNPKEQRIKASRNGSDYKLHRAIQYGVSKNNQDIAIKDEMSKDGKQKAEQLRQMRINYKKENATRRLELPPMTNPSMDWPPGWMGELSKYFYDTSIKQIKDFAILEALALCSGVFGRAYNISNTGLNNYFMTLAPSGTGKSELTAVPQKFMRLIERSNGVIDAGRFVVSETFTHRNSMMKAMQQNTCFVHTISEFGAHFRAMVKSDSTTASVRELMTDIYPKSGWNDFVGGVSYTDGDKSVVINHAVAYSFLGECVPGTFFDALNAEAFADGFVSRFMFCEYNGDIPFDNPNKGCPPNENLLTHFTNATLGVMGALRDPVNVEVMPVGMSPEVAKQFGEFSRFCTVQQNEGKDDQVWNALWSRCNLKTLKLSALLAVMDNPQVPVINIDHMNWAWEFVNRHNHLIWTAVNSGRIGGDTSKSTERQDYLERQLQEATDAKYGDHVLHKGLKEHVFADGVIPRSVISRKCKRISMFADQNGRTTEDLITMALRNMELSGIIQIIGKREMQELYKVRTEGYRFIGHD